MRIDNKIAVHIPLDNIVLKRSELLQIISWIYDLGKEKLNGKRNNDKELFKACIDYIMLRDKDSSLLKEEDLKNLDFNMSTINSAKTSYLNKSKCTNAQGRKFIVDCCKSENVDFASFLYNTNQLEDLNKYYGGSDIYNRQIKESKLFIDYSQVKDSESGLINVINNDNFNIPEEEDF